MNDNIKPLGPDPLDALAALGQYDLDSWRTERLRIQARKRFAGAHALTRKPWFRAARQTYRIILEPTFVAAVSLADLIWAFGTVLSLLR